MEFVQGVKMPLDGLLEPHDGLNYLSWSKALALSNLPSQKIVTFEDSLPFLSFFGGAVVAIDMKSSETSKASRVWLPVLDEFQVPIRYENITPSDITSALSRCKTKAVALNNGVGMSVYAGFGDNIKGFLNTLGLTPDSELAREKVPFKIFEGSHASYVEWAIAYTAAKLTDPLFTFEVLMFPFKDKQYPTIKMNNGYFVAVKVTYKGEEHTEWLPIKDYNGFSIISPTVFDWNTAVMRALTKAIAIVSGYGLSVYANDELENLLDRKPVQKKEGKPGSSLNISVTDDRATSEKIVESEASVSDEELNLLREEMVAKGINESEVLRFLNFSSDSLNSHERQVFIKVSQVVSSKPI